MGKDLKIGMLLGLALVAAAAVWLCTRPSLSIKSTMAMTKYSESTAQETNTLPITGHEEKTRTIHTVLKDETLSEISRRFYGSSNKWQKIYNANRNVIKNPDSLSPGTVLTIPD